MTWQKAFLLTLTLLLGVAGQALGNDSASSSAELQARIEAFENEASALNEFADRVDAFANANYEEDGDAVRQQELRDQALRLRSRATSLGQIKIVLSEAIEGASPERLSEIESLVERTETEIGNLIETRAALAIEMAPDAAVSVAPVAEPVLTAVPVQEEVVEQTPVLPTEMVINEDHVATDDEVNPVPPPEPITVEVLPPLDETSSPPEAEAEAEAEAEMVQAEPVPTPTQPLSLKDEFLLRQKETPEETRARLLAQSMPASSAVAPASVTETELVTAEAASVPEEELVETVAPVQSVTLTCQTALIVRTGPSADSGQLDDISCMDRNNRRTSIIVLDQQDGFYNVFVNGESGWISGEHTTDPEPLGSDVADNFIANEPMRGSLTCNTRLRRRTGPSTDYRIVGHIPCKTQGNGTNVVVLGRHERTGWYLVDYAGEKTWVSNDYVDVDGPRRLMVLTDDLIQGLGDIPDLGDVGINCDPGSPAMTRGDCIDINYDFYTKEDSGQQMAASINQAKQRGTNAKKQRFFELFSPIAIEIQTLTGWPASVSLAQMAIETNWGTSNVFRRLNNFGGHSCFQYSANGSRALRNRQLQIAAARGDRGLPGYFVGNSGNPRLRSACTYRRPANEGGFYRDFASVADAAFLYADNVLENDAYASSQRHVKEAFQNGRQADVETVVRGLRPYAADQTYRSKLLSTIRANDLTRFDDMQTCQ